MELKPFDKVLVRDDNNERWDIDIFKRYNEEENEIYPYECLFECYKQCIPYEGNESLFDTTVTLEPVYSFKDGDTVVVWNNFNPSYKYVKVFKCEVNKMYRTYLHDDGCEYENWDNCIPFKPENKE